MSKNKKQLIYFSTIETKLLQDILSTIIPGEGSFPSAEKVNVLEYIESVLEIDPILRRVYCEGLKNVEILTWQLHSVEFKDLGSQLKNEILKTIETEFPNFFELLVLHTYTGYYTDHTIIKLLDLDSVKPQPNGYKLRPFEKTLIAKVSRSSKIWRA